MVFHRRPIRKPDRRNRVALRLEVWPAEDQARWRRALQGGADIFDEAGLACHWRPATRRRAVDAYGRWLGELSKWNPAALRLPAAARVTRERITWFCELMSETNTGVSVATHLRALYDMVRVLIPEQDWGWIKQLAKQVDHQFYPRSKSNRVRTSDEIAKLGLDLIDEAEANATAGSISHAAAIKYRDGLILLLLAYAPMRRINLASLEVGRTLIHCGSKWSIVLSPGETKTHAEYVYDLPRVVCARIERYIEAFRPKIFRSANHIGFFASAKGCALPPDGAYQAICSRTLKAFGVAVNPHLIRDGAQTMWALDNPRLIRAAGALLGHADPRSGERNYNQAQPIMASRRLASIINKRGR